VAFKVIEGGGGGRPPDHSASRAVAAFKSMTIELLRAIVRGHDREARVGRFLEEFERHLANTPQDPDAIVRKAIVQLSPLIRADVDGPMHDIESVVQAALLVAAESFCTDNAAQGRVSQRRHALEARIEMMIEFRGQRKSEEKD
jgi:hypothetical protein